MFGKHSSFAPHPLALLAAAFAVGILLTHFLSIPLSVLLVCAASASLVALWSLNKRRRRSASLFILVATLLAGSLLDSIERRRAPPNQIKGLLESGAISTADPIQI